MLKNATVNVSGNLTRVENSNDFNLSATFLSPGKYEFFYIAAAKSNAGKPRLVVRAREIGAADDAWFDALVSVQQTLDFTHTSKEDLFDQIAHLGEKVYKGKLVKDMDENDKQNFIEVTRSDNGEKMKVYLTKWVKIVEE